MNQSQQLLRKKGGPPRQKVVNRFEDILQDCIQKLQQIESTLRVSGDFWRAEEVKRFRAETFGEKT